MPMSLSVCLLDPFEVKLLKREYFNRWYSLRPYYIAMQLSKIPTMVSMNYGVKVEITYLVSHEFRSTIISYHIYLQGYSIATEKHNNCKSAYGAYGSSNWRFSD